MQQGIIVVTLTLLLSTGCGREPVTVLSPDFHLDGVRVEEYAAEWWKWANASPSNENPVRDSTGQYCGVGQSGRIWYLAGGFGSGKIRRSCNVPRNKHLFFPAVNMVYWPPRGSITFTCDQAIANAAVNNDSALDIFVVIDDHTVENPKNHRAHTSECFDVYERVPTERGAYRAYPSATDGYWFMLEPLTKGTHVIRFGGRYRSSDPNEAYGRMVQDIEYIITID